MDSRVKNIIVVLLSLLFLSTVVIAIDRERKSNGVKNATKQERVKRMLLIIENSLFFIQRAIDK